MSARPVPAPSNPGVPGKSPAEPLPPLPAGPHAGRYRHFKGHEYEVLGCARHSETLEPLVIYRSTGGGNTLWARPLAMFMDTVALPNGEQVPRFARAGGSGPA